MDVEIIKSAAEACGFDVQVVQGNVWVNGDYLSPDNTHPWRPHLDSLEAFKLMNRLHINIEHASSLDDAPIIVCETIFNDRICLPHFPDGEAALRECIVLAAAQHYKRMTSAGE